MLSIRHIISAILLLIKGILTLVRESRNMSELERGIQALHATGGGNPPGGHPGSHGPGTHG